MRQAVRSRLCMMVCAVIVLAVVAAPAVWAGDLNRDLLKKGMSLNDVVLTFGQPARVEWVNLKGTAIFFLFYESEDCLLCLETIRGTGVLTQEDGRTVLPLGFVTESLAGWGKDFYQQARFPANSQ